MAVVERMRVLITGAAGRLGSELVKYLGSEHQVTATFRPSQRQLPVSCGVAVRVDLGDAPAVSEMLTRHLPEVIIHCAAATSVDRCQLDREYARVGNVLTTHNLLQGMQEVHGARLIYISTDYVFSSAEGAPAEEDTPNPINIYGESKLAAERLVQEACVTGSIFRVCALYTAAAHPKSDPVLAIYATLTNGQKYKAAVDLYSNPTEASDIARAFTGLLRLKELPQLLHIAAPEYLSRYDSAVKIAARLGLDTSLIEPVEFASLKLPAPRPLKAGLDSSRFERLLGYKLKQIDQLPALTR